LAGNDRLIDGDVVDVVLRDGATAGIRRLCGDDRAQLAAFLTRLSPDSLRSRFFSSGDLAVDKYVEQLFTTGEVDGCGLVAVSGRPPRIIAHGHWSRVGEDRAELSFEVADEYQGRGLASILLAHLAGNAREAGIAFFEASILADNRRALDMIKDTGFPVATKVGAGVVSIEVPTSPPKESIARFNDHDRIASVAAVSRVLRPQSVAVVGASTDQQSPGGRVLSNLLAAGYEGAIFPVNRRADVVQSERAYRSVADLPRAVDLAVIAVPAEFVLEVAGECAAQDIRAITVITAGFAELGDARGRERQRQLLRICRDRGMRLVGPNCLGVLNTDPSVLLNATFAPNQPLPGNVGFLSQSGALALAVIDEARELGLGLSSLVSVGNKADISGNDLLQYWESDPATDVILLYLESFGNARKFARIARRVAATKPIVAVKSGRSRAGARATTSHTGALIAGSDRTVDTLFHQAGVIRTDTLGELFDVASLLANQPLPRGRRVAIIGNAGGLGVMCADACESHGLDVVQLPQPLQADLAKVLAPGAAVGNPVDLIATAAPADYRAAIETITRHDAADAIITIFIPVEADPRAVFTEINKAALATPEKIGRASCRERV
jgi:Acyl-CoA synthetase (NDP forming)